MHELDTVLRPNVAEVAGEVIEGEAILINLATGIYHSLGGAGGAAWSLIEQECTLRELVAALVARYDVDAAQAETDLRDLVAALVAERLVVAGDARSAPRVAEPARPATPRLPYEAPRLDTYRDMGDLLALDPPAPGLQDIPWRPTTGADA